jgi:hypothetical protein
MDEPPQSSRPRRPPNRTHPHRTTLRWSNEDYASLLANAEREGVTVGTFIRSRTLAAPTTRARRRGSVEVLALAKALAMVNKMGGNLHQLARYINFGGFPEPGELRAALAGYEAMVAAIMEALGRQP